VLNLFSFCEEGFPDRQITCNKGNYWGSSCMQWLKYQQIEQNVWEPNHKVDTSVYRMFRIMRLKLQDIIIWDMFESQMLSEEGTHCLVSRIGIKNFNISYNFPCLWPILLCGFFLEAVWYLRRNKWSVVIFVLSWSIFNAVVGESSDENRVIFENCVMSLENTVMWITYSQLDLHAFWFNL